MREVSGPWPVLVKTDILVIGGGIAGVAAALAAARASRRSALIERRTYLGGDLTAGLRPWLSPGQRDKVREILGIEATFAAQERRGVVPLIPFRFKTALEDVLLRTGVELLYCMRPVSVAREDGKLVVRLAGKAGNGVAVADAIVDATEQGEAVRCLGGATPRFADGAAVTCQRGLEWTRVLEDALFSSQDEQPELLAYPGHFEEGHVIVQHPLRFEARHSGLWRSAAEVEARLASLEFARRLRTGHPAFSDANLVGSSHELLTPPLYRIRAGNDGIEGKITTPCGTFPLQAFRTPEGVWVAGGTAAVDDEPAGRLAADPAALAQLGLRVGTAAAQHAALSARPGTPAESRAPAASLAPESPPARERRSVDVLVIGGGTSGAAAAITAARSGCSVLVVEMNPGLGGTGTLGGINSYWFGRRAGFNAEVSAWVAEEHAWMGGPRRRWNVEAKMGALLRQARRHGAEVLLHSVLVDVRVDRGAVVGAVIATPEGPVDVAARVTIDATGDGDVAVRAGAEYVYGAARDGVTMWYSLTPQAKPGLTRNNKNSMVDVGDPRDYTRSILSGRRFGPGRDEGAAYYSGHDHSPYVAPRESRHVLGDVVLTLTDQLMMRRWPDVVNIAFSNHDIKGHTASDWVRFGLIPPNLEIEVPYRAMIPRGVDGVIVTGKAISATHDALAAVRMQADMENLGSVAGTAAALCVRRGVAPRALPVPLLQQALVDAGILPREVLARAVDSRRFTGEELARWVAALDDGRPLHEYANMGFDEVCREPIPFVVVCTAGPEVIPLLCSEAGREDSPRRLTAAKALAWHRHPAALPVLLAEVERQLAAGSLPGRTAAIRWADSQPPDHGAMPDLVHVLHALARLRDPAVIPVAAAIAQMLDPAPERLRDSQSGVYHYVLALCDIAERLGSPACLPYLRRIASFPALGGLISTAPLHEDHFAERAAYLEQVIARAIARCGGKEGLLTLARYLDDSRKPLVRHAWNELRAITGRELPCRAQAWLEWLEELADLPPRPCEDPGDVHVAERVAG